MDWQSWIAAGIAVVAALWAGFKIFRPIVNEFREKKMPDAGCCGCGVKSGASPCSSEKKMDVHG